jgi:hypothetical protein
MEGNIAFTEVQANPEAVTETLKKIKENFPDARARRILNMDQRIMVTYDPQDMGDVNKVIEFIERQPGVISSHTRIGKLQRGVPASRLPRDQSTCWVFVNVKPAELDENGGLKPEILDKLTSENSGVLQVANLVGTTNLAVTFSFERGNWQQMNARLRAIEIIVIVIEIDDIIIVIVDN